MTIFEVIILYIAAGAPFAVHNILQNRHTFTLSLLTSTAFRLLLWPVGAFKIVRKWLFRKRTDVQFAVNVSLDSFAEARIQEKVEKLRREFLRVDRNVSFYDFRETLDRYVALTREVARTRRPDLGHHKELFEVSGHKDVDLAAICLERHERHRLLTHQKRARVDFLSIIGSCSEYSFSQNGLVDYAGQIAKFLEDEMAEAKLRSLQAVKTDHNVIADGALCTRERSEGERSTEITRGLTTVAANLSAKD